MAWALPRARISFLSLFFIKISMTEKTANCQRAQISIPDKQSKRAGAPRKAPMTISSFTSPAPIARRAYKTISGRTRNTPLRLPVSPGPIMMLCPKAIKNPVRIQELGILLYLRSIKAATKVYMTNKQYFIFMWNETRDACRVS